MSGGRTTEGLEAQTEALRHGAGAFRPARDVLAVRGPDAEAYLQGQLSQDVEALAVGASVDALLLEPDGKLSALLRVTRTDGQGFVLDVDGGYGDAVTARLRRFLLRSKVEMERLPWRCLSLRGAAVDAAAAGLLAVLAERGVLALPFEWNGWAGTDLLGPDDVVLVLRRRGSPPGRGGVRRRRGRGVPHRLGDPRHGDRADRQDDRGRSGVGGAHRELHEGVLHRPGAGGPDRLPRLQRGAPARRRGGGAGCEARGATGRRCWCAA